METARLSLSRLHFPITALGPGRRIGLWVQGCSIRCAGCMSRDTWAFSEESQQPVEDLLGRLTPWLAEADGVTISGGEPFDQADGLISFLIGLRERFRGDVLVYSGYAFETVRARHGDYFTLIDALISEPFDETQPAAAPLRGSANQRLHILTPLGASRFATVALGSPALVTPLDVVAETDGSVWIAGIPQRGDLSRFALALAEQGIRLATSAGRLRGAS
jgi:anaerobic ribonucleoside-triphosphate reductase activating protein